MSADLSRDLELWEAGLLPADVLEGRYPDDDVRGLLTLHRGLRSVASAPIPPADRVWTRVVAGLSAPKRGPRRILRLGIALGLLLVALPGFAYASAPAVVEHGGEVIHAGLHMIGVHPPPHPAPTQAPATPHASPTRHP